MFVVDRVTQNDGRVPCLVRARARHWAGTCTLFAFVQFHLPIVTLSITRPLDAPATMSRVQDSRRNKGAHAGYKIHQCARAHPYFCHPNFKVTLICEYAMFHFSLHFRIAISLRGAHTFLSCSGVVFSDRGRTLVVCSGGVVAPFVQRARARVCADVAPNSAEILAGY
jgi:hypothetical protein